VACLAELAFASKIEPCNDAAALPGGDSPRELSVSVNTVNTHIRNIYAKLQAQDRSSAVRRAREMRLLSAGLNS
jgi:hypothetical protein